MSVDVDSLTFAQIKDLKRAFGPCKKSKGYISPGRKVFVIDRGWIYAGDPSITSDGYVRLERAVHVFKWSSIGFAKMIDEWNSSNVDLRKILPVEFPQDSIIFRVPVCESWGLK